MTENKRTADPDSFAAAHRLTARKRIALDGAAADVCVNEGETPLGWLRRRKGLNGRPLIDETQFEAGEKLRRDFTIGQLTPRVTVDWAAIGGSQPRRGAVAIRPPSPIMRSPRATALPAQWRRWGRDCRTC